MPAQPQILITFPFSYAPNTLPQSGALSVIWGFNCQSSGYPENLVLSWHICRALAWESPLISWLCSHNIWKLAHSSANGLQKTVNHKVTTGWIHTTLRHKLAAWNLLWEHSQSFFRASPVCRWLEAFHMQGIYYLSLGHNFLVKRLQFSPQHLEGYWIWITRKIYSYHVVCLCGFVLFPFKGLQTSDHHHHILW